MRPAVVKLGGSTADQAAFARWAAALGQSAPPVVVVPGGGPFADMVRREQERLRYSDAAAHAMAILAMEQFGHVLLDHVPSLAPAHSLEEMEQAARKGQSSVWMASAMALATPGIAASWEITSDSLAAWLAGQLRAAQLLLIKQTDDFSEADTVASLTARGVVDPAFETFLPPDAELHIAGPRHSEAAAALLARGALPGLRIGTANSMRRAG